MKGDPAPAARVPLWFLFTNMALVLAAFCAGIWLGGRRFEQLPEQQMQALRLIHREILDKHVDEQDAGKLLDAAIVGMVESTDEHGRYVPPAGARAFDEDTTGSYEGIGINMTTAPKGTPQIFFPFADGPAARAGLGVGDLILAIDGREFTGIEDDALNTTLRNRILGNDDDAPASGTLVTLRVARLDGTEAQIDVERGSVQKPSVRWIRLLDPELGIGYAYLGDFHRTTPEELTAALALLREDIAVAADDGQELQCLVLDLRYNGGGLLEECLEVCQQFIADGALLIRRGRNGENETIDVAHGDAPEAALRLVVLVNSRSASASEVLAGALQDHERARLVGDRTYGKGVVNQILRWTDLDFRLKLTTERYYTPDGRSIDRDHRPGRSTRKDGGIAPDVEAKLTPEASRLVRRRLESNEPSRSDLAAVKVLAAEQGIPFGPLPPTEDAQLAAALAEAQRLVDGRPSTPDSVTTSSPAKTDSPEPPKDEGAAKLNEPAAAGVGDGR